MTEIAFAIILLFLLVIFAWVGFRRGFWSELVKFAFIFLGVLVANPEWLGGIVVRVINTTYMLLVMALNGGIQAIISGDFSGETLGQLMSAAQAQGPLIDPETSEPILFLFMLILILIGFIAATKVKKRQHPFMGLFMGIVNALMLVYIFSPLLSGSIVVPSLDADTPFQAVLSIFGLALEAILKPIELIVDALGPWAIVIAIVGIVLIAARNARPKKS